MKTIKKGSPEELVSVIRELQERVQSMEDVVRASKRDYTELISILKPILEDLVDASEGQRVAKNRQWNQGNGFYLLNVTGAIKGMRKQYGGKEDSEMARVLELVTGFNAEGYRKILGQGKGGISPLDRESALDAKQQLAEFLKDYGCGKTAKIIEADKGKLG